MVEVPLNTPEYALLDPKRNRLLVLILSQKLTLAVNNNFIKVTIALTVEREMVCVLLCCKAVAFLSETNSSQNLY